MNPLNLLRGLISPKMMLDNIILNLVNEVGFQFTKMDFMFDKPGDRMFFELLLPDEYGFNPDDKDQFVKDGKVFKRYAYLDKDTIKQAVLPLLGSLTGDQVQSLDNVEAVVLRYELRNGLNNYDFVITSKVDGIAKAQVYPINE